MRNLALLFVGCVIFHVIGTWNSPLIDRDEPRFAEASREMIERGDYIVPYFNNQFRLDKPPLAYWAQVVSYRIFGENDFAARFPSAVAAALTALVIFVWGSRLPSPRRVSPSEARGDGARVGWWAAIIFTLSLQTFLHAKAAVADMWLVLFMTIAHWSGYELIQRSTSNAERVEAPGLRRPAGSGWWWMFYVSLAIAFLAKGPIGWVPLATVAATKFFLRDPQLAGRFKFVRGILFMLAIVALWGVPALIQTHGEFFLVGIGRHVVGRSFLTMEGHGANSPGMYLLLLPFYFVTLFISFFPWSIRLPWLMGKLWRSRAAGVTAPGYSALDNIDKYLIAGIAIIFMIFTLVKTKLPHYTLPAFPLLALLLARRFAAENATHFFRNCALASASVYLAIAIVVPPFVARVFPAHELFQQSRTYLQPDMQFASVDFQEPSLVWYFRGRVHSFLMPLNNRRTAEFMGSSGPRFVVLPTSMARTLFAEYPENWKMFSTRGFNIAKGKRVDLTLVLKRE
jgi:4-amino-4-deoxy-L-arabinose transferase-like glycosyltransferase